MTIEYKSEEWYKVDDRIRAAIQDTDPIALAHMINEGHGAHIEEVMYTVHIDLIEDITTKGEEELRKRSNLKVLNDLAEKFNL
tara:strand:+ start:87 stop:335 length:249 start_codon:yes stop_codon:yes gene_type:complete